MPTELTRLHPKTRVQLGVARAGDPSVGAEVMPARYRRATDSFEILSDDEVETSGYVQREQANARVPLVDFTSPPEGDGPLLGPRGVPCGKSVAHAATLGGGKH